jgi:hypothetical protein
LPTIHPTHRVALIRISKLYRQGMDTSSLYQATRRWWAVDPERGAEWAFSLSEGLVKGVFRIDGWEPGPEGSKRWGFYGERSAEMERTYFGADMSEFFTRGARNPVQYVNC